jgi:hypothetical protein
MVSGFTHLSNGGALACVPVAAAEAFAKPTVDQASQMRAAFRAFSEGGLESRLMVIDIASGELVDELAVPFWVSHVVFNPKDPMKIAFCQEGGGRIVSQRTWVWQRADEAVARRHVGARPLFPQPANEWMSHENADPSGRFIISHGGKRDGAGNRNPNEVWFDRRDWSGRLHNRYITDGTATGHAVVGTDGVTVVMDPPEYIWTWNMETNERRVLCEHNSSAREQDSHVHPVMTPDRRGVTFTSDRDGGIPNVYEWRAE